MFILRDCNDRKKTFSLTDSVSTLGKHASNTFVIDGPDILDFHVELHIQNESLYLLCLGDNNPTLVNGQSINLWRELESRDTLSLGNVQLEVFDEKSLAIAQRSESRVQQKTQQNPWLLISAHDVAEQYEILGNQPMVIGRDQQCDIVVSQGLISRRHAELTLSDDQLLIRDLKSTNGTYLNDLHISEAIARHGDVLRLDQVAFKVCNPLILETTDPIENISEDWAFIPNEVFPAVSQVTESQESFLPEASVTPASLIGVCELFMGNKFLLDKPTMTIGRAARNDIILNVATVSVEHVELTQESNMWHITDMGSLNGTFINGEKIVSAFLVDGDILKIGSVELSFRSDKMAAIPHEVPTKRTGPLAIFSKFFSSRAAKKRKKETSH